MPRMRLGALATLTALLRFTSAIILKPSWGLENEALIVRCPRNSHSYHVDWLYSKTNGSVVTQKGRVFASGKYLKFLPARVEDSGIYTCIVRSPAFNKTGYVNVTIYQKQPDCKIPDDLIYSSTSGSEKNSKIFCPTISIYNWTAPVKWFKNCKALRGSRYYAQGTYLLIDNATSEDSGDYTCKFMYKENGVEYPVTATRSFIVLKEKGFSFFPVIIAPAQNATEDVEIGKPANLTCSACFGKGPQLTPAVWWTVNDSKAANFCAARMREQQEPQQSPRSSLTCLRAVLSIAQVREADLGLRFDCRALNLHGWTRRTLRLRRRRPIDHQSTYYILVGLGVLLMLINVTVVMLKVFWIEVILLWRVVGRSYKTRNDGKLYDAYVIYPRNHKDSPEGTSSVEYFVHQVLPDVLENKCGYNLCIYGRDLLPGEDVATAVQTNIQRSRRCIFMLTPHAAPGEEFAYEQQLALHSAPCTARSSRTTPRPFSSRWTRRARRAGCSARLPDSLQHLLKVQGTIKWQEDHVANKRSLNSRFWKHVRYHMPVPDRPPRKRSSLAASKAQVQLALPQCAGVPG